MSLPTDLATYLNLLGLALITVGSIFAALASPQPQYGPDGSVSLTHETDRDKRISIHKRQTWFPRWLVIVAVGALLQASASAIQVFSALHTGQTETPTQNLSGHALTGAILMSGSSFTESSADTSCGDSGGGGE